MINKCIQIILVQLFRLNYQKTLIYFCKNTTNLVNALEELKISKKINIVARW